MSERQSKLPVYLGYDPDQQEAYDVAAFSAERRGSTVHKLDLDELRQTHVYTREDDPLASTPFTFSRYLVPYLQDFKGWALFADCDVLFLEDPSKLLEYADPNMAVHVVKHDYTSAVRTKMNGKVQHTYPRKNWTSVMLFNCEHPLNAALVPQLINDRSKAGQWFHRLTWLKDSMIGELPIGWNYLTDTYVGGDPKIFHYTAGGPWLEGYEDTPRADAWFREKELMKTTG